MMGPSFHLYALHPSIFYQSSIINVYALQDEVIPRDVASGSPKKLSLSQLSAAFSVASGQPLSRPSRALCSVGPI